MPAPLSATHRKRLETITSDARDAATAACRAALENLAVHEADYRPHMSIEQRQLRNRLRARGKALGDARDERSGKQEIKRLSEEAAFEHWHRLLFTRFLAENHLLITDAAHGHVLVTLAECEGLATELGARDGFDLACRFASTTLPGVFRLDDPVLDLAFPADDRKNLRDLLDAIPPDVFTASDALGWTYQFWQSKRKKEVNESGSKIGADELSPVTQLFTEDYMVDFLLDNTLGAWHAGKVLAANPKLATTAQNEEELRQVVSLPGCPWKYLRFIKVESDGKAEDSPSSLIPPPSSSFWAPAAGTFDGWPKIAKELTCLDPCMGSGHFVVALFERLVALRMAEENLDETAAVTAVIRDNLFGLEIDPRCTQIAAFNLALAAWRRVGHCPLPAMNLACSGLAPNAREADWLAIAGDNEKLRAGMERLYRLFQNAPILGSLINPRAGADDLLVASFHELQPLLEQALAQEAKDDTAHEMAVTAQGIAKAADILAGEFTLVATNVPYLGRGKQDDVLQDYCQRVYPDSKADLATCFIERCLGYGADGGTAALVAPQNWLFLASYKKFREKILQGVCWTMVARLGESAFESAQAAGAFTALLSLTNQKPSEDSSFTGQSVANEKNPESKAEVIRSGSITVFTQFEQLKNPDAIVTVESLGSGTLLQEYATAYEGAKTVDIERFRHLFWELSSISINEWWFHNSSPKGDALITGCHYISANRSPGSKFAKNIQTYEENGQKVVAWLCGKPCWENRGVAVAWMRELPASLYIGTVFDNSAAVIMPLRQEYLTAIYTFVTSGEYSRNIRKLNQKVQVAAGTLDKVPFDLAHWQKVAAEKYPDGLPKPYSSDPTQWLFNGHPLNSDQPLHVAVARLLGYRWPRQTGSSFPDCPALDADGLEPCADDDGVVCLAALNREQPAATRLRALLTAALGAYDERDLIRQAGVKGKPSTKTTLEDWLRDDFFTQHCALFHSRPFIWHLWDGLKDGFHALVNYHRLDHAKLQTLTYTYLGDWIRDQQAAAKADTPGAAERLGAAQALQARIIAILEGEAPLDLFIRWKPLHQQPIGWHPDLNDGVRLNIRPFLLAGDVGPKGAGLFRAKPGIDPRPKPDRGTEPQRPKSDYPWFWCADDPGTDPTGGQAFTGRRWNTAHFTLKTKQDARTQTQEMSS
jgi:hypothetical protein